MQMFICIIREALLEQLAKLTASVYSPPTTVLRIHQQTKHVLPFTGREKDPRAVKKQ
jgi:hypothetical protein